jgi:glycerophosphoryl diester phosphodiesterase
MSFADAVVIIGHRGAAGLEPENTLPSFRRAYACGVSAVELDVYCVEGALVVIHDDTLERTTNGYGSRHGPDSGRPARVWTPAAAGPAVAGGGGGELPADVGSTSSSKGRTPRPRWRRFLARHPKLDVLVSSFASAAS